MQNYKSIFLYNKNDELETYIETNSSEELIGYYNLLNKVLTKVNVSTKKEKNKIIKEEKKAKIVFAEDCVLNHMFLEGSSRIVVYKKNSNKLESPAIESKIYSLNNSLIKEYTIDNNLLQSWLKKL